LFSYSGIALARNIVAALRIQPAIDEGLSILKRSKPYHESDHILNMVYNFLTGGECLRDIKRLQAQEAYMKILGTESIPDPTTAGDFLVRFDDQQIACFQKMLDEIQDESFRRMDKKKKALASIDSDSSIHEVYGQKKEGADYAYDNTYSYHPLYVTLNETGDILHLQLREGNAYSSAGIKEVLPGIIDRVKKHFAFVRYRADSSFYDKQIVGICDDSDVKFFIVADQTQRIMKQVISIDEGEWKCFRRKKLGAGKRKGIKKRKKRKNQKRLIAKKRLPKKKTKGGSQIASFLYKPVGWKKAYRFVVKRTEIIDPSKQMYLQEELCKYEYYIVVTNSSKSNAVVMNIAQGRANQENLIKDFKYGLGLSHVPTGFLNANKIYFKIAALAWNIKTWMLNLLDIGNGAVLRFKRFMYLWINHAAIVSKTGVNTVVLRMDPGEYYAKFSKALDAVGLL
jgi:hypothetical protein